MGSPSTMAKHRLRREWLVSSFWEPRASRPLARSAPRARSRLTWCNDKARRSPPRGERLRVILRHSAYRPNAS